MTSLLATNLHFLLTNRHRILLWAAVCLARNDCTPNCMQTGVASFRQKMEAKGSQVKGFRKGF